MSQQFRQIPVKVYLSTDENAPIVHSDKSNEVLSMLRKNCWKVENEISWQQSHTVLQ